MNIETRPYYIVYGGWYGQDDEEWTYGAWTPCGHDQRMALARLADIQQQDFDFCGIHIAFAS